MPDPGRQHDGSEDRTQEPQERGTSRRRILIGAGAAAALAVGGGAAALRWAGSHEGGDGTDERRTPSPTALEPRDYPARIPTELEELAPLSLAQEDLGIVFRTVSVQDAARMPAPADGGVQRLLITQHGARGQIQYVDVAGQEDPIVFDADQGVNPGVAVSEDGVSYFVTREEGRLLRVDADLAQLEDLGRPSEDATSLYSPVIGSGGTVFGGSYPIGAVWAADPGTGEIRVGPRIGDNLYVRSLAVVGDAVYAGTGGDEPMLVLVDPAGLGPSQRFAVPGVRAGGSVSRLVSLSDGRLLVYRDEEDGGSDGIVFDPATGEFAQELSPGASSRSFAIDPAGGGMIYVAGSTVMRWSPQGDPEEVGASAIEDPAAVVSLADGTVIALIADPEGGARVRVAGISPIGEARDLPITASGHDITAVIPMPSTGHLAIGGYQGDGLVVLDPATGAAAHTRRGTGVQQVEGGIESGEGAVVVGSYGEGRVHEAQLDGEEEVLAVDQVDDLGAELGQGRPIAWAALSGGSFAVGTVPEQGREGGLLRTYDRPAARLEPADLVEDPAPGLSIVGVAEVAEGEVVLTTSVQGGYGTLSDATSSRVLRLRVADGEVLWETEVPVLDSGSPVIQQGRVVCATTSGVLVLDADSGELLADVVIGEAAASAGYTSSRIEPWGAEGRFLHAARGRLSMIDLVDGTLAWGSEGVGAPLTSMGGEVYAASGASLLRFTLPTG